MADLVLQFGAAAAVGAGCVILSQLILRPRHNAIPPAALPLPAPDLAEPAPPPAEPAAPPTLNAIITKLTGALSPVADDLAHPGQLTAMPEFTAIVDALRRPEATFEMLTQYALGGNWPLACAAYVVLAEHPDRAKFTAEALRHLEHIRPFVILYTLRFLAALQPRPQAGAPLLHAHPWWQQNPVIPGFFEEFFTSLAAFGDKPGFGPGLLQRPQLDIAPILGVLAKIRHPFVPALQAALQGWGAARIDGDYLATIGTLWTPEDEDTLLVQPAAWSDFIGIARSAIAQSKPRSILVTGEPFSGKTALIELLCAQLHEDGWTIFSAGGTELQADQSYIGQLEGRIRKLVAALHAGRRLIWHIPDFGQLAESGKHQGQSASILDQILPAIVAGNLIVIGELGRNAATRLFQIKPALRALFEILPLQSMTEAETASLATDVSARITATTAITVSAQTVAATMDLAQQYLGIGQLPGVVLDLLKRAASTAISAQAGALTPDHVVTTLSQLSGLPSLILDTTQRADLAAMRAFFASRVIGQDEAVSAVVDRIAMLKAGLTDPTRPVGVFLFAGPTGTGKTELAKTLAQFLFGSPDRMIRLDMSEFQTHEATVKILGDSRGTTTDSLIDRVRKQPFSVILLDEFEKANASVWDLFLQIFDDGRLSDASGRHADFRHCFIILTSNLGATAHRGSSLGFRPTEPADAEQPVLQTVAQTFRPEFVNRLDKIIVFRPLSRELMRGVLHKELALVLERRGLRERAWAVEWESSAIEFLLDRGFSREMGARPLKRAIDQLLLAPLAATMVEHRFPQGDQFLFVRANGRAIEVEFVDPDGAPPPSPEAEPLADLSLAAIVLRQTGSPAERAALTACWHAIAAHLAGEEWSRASTDRQFALADPEFWQRPDRTRVLSAIELADRVAEAARTGERLFQRYTAAPASSKGENTARASRELALRLALQLYNIRQGLDDMAAGAPVDAILFVAPAMDTDPADPSVQEWCARLTGMYRGWAARRRLQIAEIKHPTQSGTILHVSGFGAYRTLQTEIGLHVWDEPSAGATRRISARVTAAPGPDEDITERMRGAALAKLLLVPPASATIIRRYRAEPSPLVRDLATGWRNGRLDLVLGGDFDLLVSSARAAAA